MINNWGAAWINYNLWNFISYTVCPRSPSIAEFLSWLVANVGEPKPSRRRLLMSFVHSILLYGADVWAEALFVSKGVGGGSVDDCEGYAHQAYGEATKISLR